MSHYCEILSFSAKTSKQKIQTECDMWGNENCDPEERGGRHGGLEGSVRFTGLVFESYEEARHYLDKTFGKYQQTAVQYKKYPDVKSAKLDNLKKKIKETKKKLFDLDSTPHYKGVKQATVKCKCCGSSLATSYCGSTYYNFCPVCKSELRPETVLNRIQGYKDNLKKLEKELKAEEKALQKKVAHKAELFWAVACEVHC